jgi:hypothetical protein
VLFANLGDDFRLDSKYDSHPLGMHRKITIRMEQLMAKAKTSKRELIDTGKDKRYVRRNEKGQFDDVVDVGRSLSRDIKQKATKRVPAGQGDRGDQKPRRKG